MKRKEKQTRNFLLLQHESTPTFEPKLEHQPFKLKEIKTQ